jgi:hypothetical protein
MISLNEENGFSRTCLILMLDIACRYVRLPDLADKTAADQHVADETAVEADTQY